MEFVERQFMRRWPHMICIAALMLASCGGKKDVTQYMTSREHFEYAMRFFKKKNWTKAQEEFALVTYKYSGSDVADDAQFYIGECYYNLKDYVTAAAEYDRLVTAYPKSDWVEMGMYRLVLCYYELSPGYALDQKFTLDAVNAIQNFLDLFPNSERRGEVEKYFTEIKTKLAKKHFESAHIYRRLGEYEAAIVYYDQVITDYYDGPYVAPAHYWKGYCYYKIKDFAKARLVLTRFIEEKGADPEMIKEAKEILVEIGKDQVRLENTASRDQR